MLLVTSFFFSLRNIETAKDEYVITFFLGAIHEKHNFKYFKNPTVKVCKIWCNYVYMYILYCSIFWWKLIDRIFFKQMFNTRMVPQGIPPFFPQFPLFARDYLQTGYSYMLDISYLLNNNTVKCIKAKIFPFNQK